MNSLLQEGILSTRNVSHAAILNRHGIAKVKSPYFEMTLAEWHSLESAFDSPAVARGSGPNQGLQFMGKQYRAVRADKNSVYAKTSQGNGVVIAKTQSHYIVAAYDPDMYASVCVEAVEKLAAYLRTKNK